MTTCFLNESGFLKRVPEYSHKKPAYQLNSKHNEEQTLFNSQLSCATSLHGPLLNAPSLRNLQEK